MNKQTQKTLELISKLQSIKTNFEPYKEPCGLVHPWKLGPTKSPSSQNGLSYLGFYICLLYAFGLSEEDVNQVVSALEYCKINNRWILGRHPSCLDQQSWDDLVSAASMIVVSKQFEIGKEILKEYEKAFWYVPTDRHSGASFLKKSNGKFNFDAYLGRFFQLRFTAALAAKKSPSFLTSLIWSLGVYSASKKPLINKSGDHFNQGSYRMTYLMVTAYNSQDFFKSKLCSWVSKKFLSSFKEKGISLKETQIEYFHEGHPFFSLIDLVEG
jgi:hypothetical protein